ncbi:MAG TPA: alpha/beta hydrolase [Candidatus Hydrogenedentes bacterium]|nr:alpha/beta hydrolase [Candidatus Hydrogenedentota bacterium]
MSTAISLTRWLPWVNPLSAWTMEKELLTDQARAKMQGKTFVRLSAGVTHYELDGPEDGEVVVFIHGLTAPSFVWDYQFRTFAKAGFRVLRYDLFGRGLSDRPRAKYTADFLDQQLVELLDALGITKPVHLVTLSMGASIVMNFIDRHPERVQRFALFGPAGFPVHVPFKYKLVQSPIIGDILFKITGNTIFRKSLNRQPIRDLRRKQELKTRFLEQMRFKGFKRCVLSTLRHNPVLNLHNVYQRVGRHGHKGILFWGASDHVTPFEHHRFVQNAIPHIIFHPFKDEGHTLNYERPELVNPLLLDFLQA